MKIATIVVTFFLAVMPVLALACSPIPPSENIGRSAERVFVGLSIDSSRPGTHFYEALVDIRVTEVVKGRAAKKLTAVSPCARPFKKGERVVVVGVNHNWVAYPANLYEKSIRVGARGGR